MDRKWKRKFLYFFSLIPLTRSSSFPFFNDTLLLDAPASNLLKYAPKHLKRGCYYLKQIRYGRQEQPQPSNILEVVA